MPIAGGTQIINSTSFEAHGMKVSGDKKLSCLGLTADWLDTCIWFLRVVGVLYNALLQLVNPPHVPHVHITLLVLEILSQYE